ncbi:co-chaperone DjlA [Halopseudomonas pelagia]|uniref:co-chaperone DjlA n=1 Tax=Halopseudomonas pelagia TaxID=553151 RepID=UPI00039A3F59|nr:co-chaperone DjlA [Halopseudomonas pelagia]
MLWPVTVVGAALGGAIAGIPGGIFGAVLGHALDRHWQLQRWSDLPRRWRELSGREAGFEQVLFLCLGRLAKAEGRVLPAHLQLARDLMQQYRLDDGLRLQAMQWFNQGKIPNQRLTPLVRRLLKREPERAAELLDCCWRMALADGVLGAQERELLDEWGGHAGLGRAEQQRMHQRHQSRAGYAQSGAKPQSGGARTASRDRLQEAASLLEVDLSAPPEEIKRAYRRQLSRYHPDKLIARGIDVGANGAGERIHRIQEAYEQIKRYRGFR